MTQITLVTMMKDEGPYLIEWVAYHLAIGFTRIVVYTNNCQDGTPEMLERLGAVLPVIHCPNPVPAHQKPQAAALKRATDSPLVQGSDWVMVLDCDEFLDLRSRRLPEFIALMEADGHVDAIALTWRFMGSCGLMHWNPGLVTQSYVQGARDGFQRGWGVKTLFRPFPHMRLGIHRPAIAGQKRQAARKDILAAQAWVNGSGLPLPPRFKRDAWRSSPLTLGRDFGEVKHYATRSCENYLLRGMRGNVNNKKGKYDLAYFTIFDRNEKTDHGLLTQGPALDQEISGLLCDGALQRLYHSSLEFHAARLARLQARPDYADAIAALQAAHRFPYSRLDEVLFTQPLPPVAKDMVARMRAEGQSDPSIAQMIAHSPLIAAKEAQIEAEDRAFYQEIGLTPPRTEPE